MIARGYRLGDGVAIKESHAGIFLDVGIVLFTLIIVMVPWTYTRFKTRRTVHQKQEVNLSVQ